MSESQWSEALYYPHMRVVRPAPSDTGVNRAWLLSQLLYFDRIGTISPWHVPDVPTCRDEEELIEAGVIVRHAPGETTAAVERASRFMALLLVTSQQGGLVSHFAHNPLYRTSSREALDMLRRLSAPERERSVRRLIPQIAEFEDELKEILTDRFVRMYPEKMTGQLQNFLRTSNATALDEGRWLEVDPVFASIYMTILAREMSEELNLSGTTDEVIHDTIYQELTATIWGNPAPNYRRSEGVFVDVIMPSRLIDPATPISQVLKFKENRNCSPRSGGYFRG